MAMTFWVVGALDDDPTSFTAVGHAADSPAPLLRPSAATGQDADMRDVEDPDLGYYVGNSL
jgi:hypothetical protein